MARSQKVTMREHAPLHTTACAYPARTALRKRKQRNCKSKQHSGHGVYRRFRGKRHGRDTLGAPVSFSLESDDTHPPAAAQTPISPLSRLAVCPQAPRQSLIAEVRSRLLCLLLTDDSFNLLSGSWFCVAHRPKHNFVVACPSA